ncbi:patatin-like phospholipase family protein [Jatrophihabitans fulvus]
MSGRALVLGGGGITGIAWELGLLAGLAERGVRLENADRVVGTSAGSVVGAQLLSGASLEDLYAGQLEEPTREIKGASLGRAVFARYAWALVRARGDRTRFARLLGAMSIRAAAAGRLPSIGSRLRAIESRLPSREWPEADLRITVVDARSGEFRVITRADGVPLARAVAASCAVPGVYPPVPLDGRLYIDGGVRSFANADLARGCSRVVAVAPADRAVPGVPSTAATLGRLGVPHALVMPDAAAVAAIGKDVLDLSARAASARAGRDQAASVTDEIAAVWG